MGWKPDYATLPQAREYVTRHSSTVDDTFLALDLATASRAVDRATNRQFGLVDAPELRYYTPHWDRDLLRWVIEFDDLQTTAGFDPQIQDANGDNLGAVDAYVLEPRNAPADGEPWTRMVVRPGSAFAPTGLRDQAAFTGRWGWTEIPTPITEATLMQTNRFQTRRVSPYGVAGSPDEGSEMRLLARLDPDVAVAVGPYRRWWAAA
jgi:hypothetical protein